MNLDDFTPEFRKIFNRYKNHILESKKKVPNDIVKLLDERNKQIIIKQDEEELLFEEALQGLADKYSLGSNDKSIRNRMKLGGSKNLNKKKLGKKNLLKLLDRDENQLQDENLNLSITSDSSYNKINLPSPERLTKNSIKLTNMFKLEVKSEKENNLNKLKRMIENYPVIQNKIAKVLNDKIKFETKRIFSPVCLTENSYIRYSQSTETSESRLNMKIKQEYNNNLKQIANYQETNHILKTIEKQKKLQNYLNKIENYEVRLLRLRDMSVRVLDMYDERTSQLKIKYKRVYEKNFAGI
jgi:hypothetical protein